jgi:hypothetical protein
MTSTASWPCAERSPYLFSATSTLPGPLEQHTPPYENRRALTTTSLTMRRVHIPSLCFSRPSTASLHARILTSSPSPICSLLNSAKPNPILAFRKWPIMATHSRSRRAASTGTFGVHRKARDVSRSKIVRTPPLESDCHVADDTDRLKYRLRCHDRRIRRDMSVHDLRSRRDQVSSSSLFLSNEAR